MISALKKGLEGHEEYFFDLVGRYVHLDGNAPVASIIE